MFALRFVCRFGLGGETMEQGAKDRWTLWVLGIVLGALALTLLWRVNLTARWFYERPYHDIWYMYQEGRRILEGTNPYERVLESDRLHNKKYPTYLPGFYCLAAATQALGLKDYKTWVNVWAWVFILFQLGLAALLFRECLRRADLVFALFAGFFWLFNRWTLYVDLVAHSDPMALFFLFLAMLLLQRRPRTAALMFGVSLAVKQIGIFMVPLFAVWFWQQASERRLARTVALMGWALLIPVALSLPFFVWNPKGFIWSVGFSVTRLAGGSFATYSLDDILNLRGLVAKGPLLVLMACVYYFAWRRHVRPFGAATLIFALFITFHSVMYQQYVCWVLPFLPVALLEWRCAPKEEL